MKIGWLRNFGFFTVIALTCALAALLGGCKGNTSAAANLERQIGPPPTITAQFASVDPRNLDPLTTSLWTHASWFSFCAPINANRAAAASSAAILSDASTLYVAFINTAQSGDIRRDADSLYLDTTPQGDGLNMLQFTVDSTGASECAWIHLEARAQPKPDGSPDFGTPFTRSTDVPLGGYFANVNHAADRWTAVMAIPLANLPGPLKTAAAPGSRWKMNLVRTVLLNGPGRGQEFQSNLSPIYVGAQAVSPNRMADLMLPQ